MKPFPFDRAIKVVGWCLFALAIGIPLIGLLADVIVAGCAPQGGWLMSDRQWTLFGKSVVLATLAGLCSLALALPGAVVLAGRSHAARLVVMTLLAMALLFPPTVLAFGWDKLTAADTALGNALRGAGLETLTHGPGRTVWVWSCWLWPVGTILLALGWRRVGRPVYELAIIDARKLSTFCFAVLPAMRLFLVAAWALVFVVCVTDYQVPHACGQLVFATELVSWITETGKSIDVAFPSLPLTLLVVAVVLTCFLWARRDAPRWETQSDTTARTKGSVAIASVIAVLAVTVLLPVIALAGSTNLSVAMTKAWAVYSRDLAQSIGLAALAALGGAVLAETLSRRNTLARLAAVITFAMGILPGALLGRSLVAAYLRFPLIYDHWPVMMLTYVARFGWISLLAAWLARASLPPHLLEQAHVDGAGAAQADRFIRWPLTWPILAAGGAAFLAMALAEVPAISLTRVPGIGNIALSLIEKFHRFEDDILVALSLWLSAAVLPAVLLVLLALRKRQSVAE